MENKKAVLSKILQGFIWFWKVLKRYLSNCTIHGVKYLVSENCLYLERLFWLLFCVLSWWGCAEVIMNSVSEYNEYPVDVTSDTLYVNWETPFPSIAVCIKSSNELKISYKFKQQPSTLEFSSKEKQGVTADELLKAYQSVQIPCREIFANCIWNNVKFDCCKEFKALNKTGIGYCYAVNSKHFKPYDNSNIKFWINGTTESGNFVIDLIANQKTIAYIPRYINVYILDNLQLPISGTLAEYIITNMRKGSSTRIEFAMVPTHNEKQVQSSLIQQRNCRFSHEIDKDSMYEIYSTDSCAIEVYIQKMIKYCGCVSFYYPVPAGARTCNLTELLCLSENKKDILLVTNVNKKCYPLCEGTTTNVYHSNPIEYSDVDDDIIRIDLISLSRPLVQYRRFIVRSLLDLIVAVGSALGLFMGASILSFFEIPYWFFLRHDEIA
ncbi:PREDICTED: sodium channel protein Nach [Polistes canadensis]|uniref:sodium channel protein Nach n=1 Tax=Polistes canadensis TaxID=91411 RepID=UPI000718B6F5|nr:PREDICTED: sodium channel protein Nach [Polistes canadensis]